MSSCFSNAKLASACAGIFYFLSYIPYAYISIKEDLSFEGLCGVMLKTLAVCIQLLCGELFRKGKCYLIPLAYTVFTFSWMYVRRCTMHKYETLHFISRNWHKEKIVL